MFAWLVGTALRRQDSLDYALVDSLQVEFVVSFLAVTFARAVAAPLNSAYKPDEFSFYLQVG